MECQGVRKLSSDNNHGEEKTFVNEYGSRFNDLVDDVFPQNDLGISKKSTCKSWVQKKRDSFELMCASNNENLHHKGNFMKTEKSPTKETFKEYVKKNELKINQPIYNLHIREQAPTQDNIAKEKDMNKNEQEI